MVKKSNKLYGDEGTFRPFTLVCAADGRFCRVSPGPDDQKVFVRFRDQSGSVREETLDTQEAINQICVMLINGYEETYDDDSGGPVRILQDLADEIELTSPCLFLN